MAKTYLKIKIMSLAAEGKIIRREEHRWKKRHPVREGLQSHRRLVVRPEARVSLLAYGYLRGRAYASLEAKCYEEPNWSRVAKLADRYQPGILYDGRLVKSPITREMILDWARAPRDVQMAA